MTLPPNAHLDENVLFDCGSVRWPEEMERHVGTCPACAARLREWERATDRVRSLLQTAAAPVTVVADHRRRLARLASPPPRRLRFGLVAAAVPLGFLILFSVTPVRAWVVERWRAIVTGIAPESPPSPAPTPDHVAAGTAILSFVPAGAGFTVEFDSAQADGVVTLRTGPGPEASLRVLTTPPGDNVLVTPSGIRVRNPRTSRASYLITVPSGVTLVTVRVEGVTMRTVSRAEMTAADVPVSLRTP